MHGPIGRVVFAHLDDLNHFLDEHDITNARVFGSVARGDDTEASDLDLLIDVPPGTSLFELVRWQNELAELLGVRGRPRDGRQDPHPRARRSRGDPRRRPRQIPQ